MAHSRVWIICLSWGKSPAFIMGSMEADGAFLRERRAAMSLSCDIAKLPTVLLHVHVAKRNAARCFVHT